MTISISGTVYTDEGSTTIGSGRILNCSVNGAASSGNTTTGSDGTYTISGITAAAAAVITIYIQDGINTEVAVTVTRSTGSNISGIDLYQDHLNIRSDDGTAFSGTNLNTSDNNGATGISSIFTASSNSSVTLVIGKSLCIMSGQTYAPVSGSVIVGASWVNNGTFTKGSSAVTLSGTGTHILKSNGSSFANISIAGAGGTYTLQDNLTSTTILTFGNGTLDVSSGNYSVSSVAFTTTSGSFNGRAGTLTMTASTTAVMKLPSGVFNVVVGGNTGTVTLSGPLTASGSLTINNGKTLDVKSGSDFAVNVAGNWVNNGTFTAQLGTVTLNGTNQTISGSTTFYNLVANNSGDVVTFMDGTTQTISNAATFQNVTLQGSSTGGWTVAMPATQTIDHVTVSYSTATGNTAVAGNTSTNGGNNINWTFGASPSGFSRPRRVGTGSFKKFKKLLGG